MNRDELFNQLKQKLTENCERSYGIDEDRKYYVADIHLKNGNYIRLHFPEFSRDWLESSLESYLYDLDKDNLEKIWFMTL